MDVADVLRTDTETCVGLEVDSTVTVTIEVCGELDGCWLNSWEEVAVAGIAVAN